MSFQDIEDLAVDSNFEVFIDHRGDLGSVKGRSAFNQKLVIRLTERLRNIIGTSNADKETIKELARTHAQRVANQMDELDNIASFSAAFPDDKIGVLEVTIVFDTGEPLTFEIES